MRPAVLVLALLAAGCVAPDGPTGREGPPEDLGRLRIAAVEATARTETDAVAALRIVVHAEEDKHALAGTVVRVETDAGARWDHRLPADAAAHGSPHVFRATRAGDGTPVDVVTPGAPVALDLALDEALPAGARVRIIAVPALGHGDWTTYHAR